jgi:hypothetical protein
MWPAAEHIGTARVSRRSTRLGWSTTRWHRPWRCARTPTAFSYFSSASAPAVSFIAVDSPASRKRPVAICKRSLPSRVCTARLSRQLQGFVLSD